MTLRFLYLGDVMARPGRRVVVRMLPALREKYKPDIVLAQAENATHGKGMNVGHMLELQAAGVDVFTGGNHTIEQPSVLPLLARADVPVLAPINQPGVTPEWGAKVVQTQHGDVQVISVLGTIFPEINAPMGNPLRMVDEVLEATKDQDFAARIVNIHGDYSSEKRVIGYYLDGRVSAVIGDHWHVPTADAMILPGGTAHITDVGMCGTLHSSLGISKEAIIARWRDGAKTKNEIAEDGPYQLNAVVVSVDTKTALATSIKSINQIIE